MPIELGNTQTRCTFPIFVLFLINLFFSLAAGTHHCRLFYITVDGLNKQRPQVGPKYRPIIFFQSWIWPNYLFMAPVLKYTWYFYFIRFILIFTILGLKYRLMVFILMKLKCKPIVYIFNVVDLKCRLMIYVWIVLKCKSIVYILMLYVWNINSI